MSVGTAPLVHPTVPPAERHLTNHGPLRGGVDFFVNEEWRSAIAPENCCAAGLRSYVIDPDDEPVRMRPLADDNALLDDCARYRAQLKHLAALCGMASARLCEPVSTDDVRAAKECVSVGVEVMRQLVTEDRK